MKQFFFGLAACGLAAVLPVQAANVAAAKVMATANTDQTGPVPAATNDSSDSSLCLDSMETVPEDDDLVPTPAAVDGGCSVSADTIAT